MLLLLNLNQGPEWSSKDQSKEPWMSFSVCCIDLSLRWRNFLDHDSGHGVQSSKSICSFPSHAPTDIDSHSDGSLVDSFAVSSNLSNFVNVRVCSSVIWGDKHLAINGERFATYHTIERWKTIANSSRDIQRFWCRHCTPLLRRCYRHVYEKRSAKKRNKDVEIHQNQKERKSLSIKSFRLSLDAIRVINLNKPFSAAFYLYQSTVFTLFNVLPRTLFPVSLQSLATLFTFSPFRSHFSTCSCLSSKALVSPWPYRSLISWWPYRSLISLGSISSIEPRDPWLAIGRNVDDSWALRLCLILI